MTSSLKKPWDASAGQSLIATNDRPLAEYLAATSQDHLFQADILKEALGYLEKQGLVEAYVRGSFAHQEADEHSDIDLFLVVEPEKLESTFEAFTQYLQDKYTIMVSCHDKLVKDFGGIGFMYLCGDANNKMFQFDLYTAIKGVAPRAELPADTPRVYSADPSYCWKTDKASFDRPQCVESFISKFSAGDGKQEKMEYLCNDLMVTLSIMKKHLIRGQVTRALNDNNHAIGVCIEMLRAEFQDQTPHSSLYAGDQMIIAAKKSNDPVYKKIAQDLERELLNPVSLNKVEALFEIGRTMVQKASPDAYNAIAPSLAAYQHMVVDACKGGAGSAVPLKKPVNDVKLAPQ